MRASRFSRLARALRERTRLASARTRSSVASKASGLECRDDPPETVNLIVGDLSVAVTNAGEYVFLLEKCINYPISTFPVLTNLSFTAVDDCPSGANLLSASVGSPDEMDGWWTEDDRRFAVHYTALSGWIVVADSCLWRSGLYVTPATWQPTECDPSETFTAADDIYAQVGVTLNLIEPVVVTNLPSAYDVHVATVTNDAAWSFNQLVDIASGTDGLECYFINEFITDDPAREVLGLNDARGLALAKAGNSITLAHEIGHAFGMRDIYAQTPSGAMLPEYVKPCYSNLPHDWNGGCIGRESGGVRYYARGTSQRMIIRRMLMDGFKVDESEGRCITFGSVCGLGKSGSGHAQMNVATGFFYDADGDNNYNPTHD